MADECRRIRAGLGDRAACATHGNLWPCVVKALSLTRPWTELILAGIKEVENRSWATSYRGPLVVHGAKSWDDGAADLLNDLSNDGMLNDDDYAALDACLLTSAAPVGYLGVVTVTDCHRAGDLECVSRETATSPDGLCSPWAFDGSYHWTIADAHRFAEIVPGSGHLSMFTPDDDAVGQLRDLMWEAGCRE